jgi:peroxiredoxin
MPSIQRLHEAYRERGLRVVAISVDERGAEPLLREFVAEHRLTFDVIHDEHSAVMTAYQVRGVPQTFLISRDGKIVGTRFVADWASAESRRLVDSLLFGVRKLGDEQ